MCETELKFQVPAGVHDALEAELLRRGATWVRMEAIYHDTPDRDLAESKLALRLRHEGDKWVQTLKASRDSSVRRSEHSVALLPPKDGAQPVLDVARHEGSDAYPELCKVLDGQGGPGTLVEIFRTRVQRLHCEIDVVGSVIEAAFDTGAVVTGDRSSPISELRRVDFFTFARFPMIVSVSVEPSTVLPFPIDTFGPMTDWLSVTSSSIYTGS